MTTNQLAADFAAHTLASPLSPDHLLGSYGLIGLLAILFAETGLLVGFFLPGDTLLFSAGLVLAINDPSVNLPPLWVLLVLLPLAAIAGNIVGYWIGYKTGPSVFDKPNSRLFRPEYVERSHAFFEKYGAATILLARFVPIVRTFAAVMAGVSKMRLSLFVIYSVIGGILWTWSMTLLGYWLAHIEFVRKTIEPHLDLILVTVIVLSLLPTLVHVIRGRKVPS
jgi:membrane-associated protein